MVWRSVTNNSTNSWTQIKIVIQLQEVADVVAPFIYELLNRLLSTGYFPIRFKEAFITPVIKKPQFDTADVNSYRVIFNVSVILKLLEHLTVQHLIEYLTSANLCYSYSWDWDWVIRQKQPCYGCCLSDILQAVHRGDVAAQNSNNCLSLSVCLSICLSVCPPVCLCKLYWQNSQWYKRSTLCLNGRRQKQFMVRTVHGVNSPLWPGLMVMDAGYCLCVHIFFKVT